MNNAEPLTQSSSWLGRFRWCSARTNSYHNGCYSSCVTFNIE